MDVTVYERDRGFVLSKLREGEFDYVDTGDEVFEADFFRYISAKGILEELSATYPTPRKKEEVPVWLALGSAISMRLHGAEAFRQYEYVIRCGGMMNAFGPKLGSKKEDERTGDIKLDCQGFNQKNSYPRETPCSQDFLRKFYRCTDSQRVQQWYNVELAKIWKRRHAYDKDGLFIGDGSYLFVPDNPNYEGASKMLFDKHNHPVDPKKANKADLKAGKYQWRRCYKLVNLLHAYPDSECFLIVAFLVMPGKESELPAFYALLETFLEAVGEGVVKRLILDRGFLDGERIGHLKQKHGIDVLIPVKSSMDIYADALGLVDEVKFKDYMLPEPEVDEKIVTSPRPDAVVKRESKRQRTLEKRKAERPLPQPDKRVIRQQVGSISGFRSWSTCTVPLSIIYCRDIYADGHYDQWLLLDTAPVEDAASVRNEYRSRTQIEERYRQLKCFTDLTAFTSRQFSLVIHQVLTVMLTYSLIQLYLKRNERAELNRKPMTRVRKHLLPVASYVIVYCQDKVAFFDRLEYSEILLSLEDEARRKALARIRRLRRETAIMRDAQAPP